MKKLSLTLFIIILCITGFGLSIHGKSAGFINLVHEQDERFHVVRIEGFNLEHPFFGLAFHLNYDEKLFEFDHFTLGDYFTTENDPLTLVSKDQNESKIVTGLSLKRGQLIDKSEGTFLKLYFKKKIYDPSIYGFVFEQGVFSTFDKERMDIENVEFGTV